MTDQPKPARSERPDTVRVRLPKALSEHLHEMAEEQGTTMNTLLVLLLAEATGFSLRPTPEEASDDDAG